MKKFVIALLLTSVSAALFAGGGGEKEAGASAEEEVVIRLATSASGTEVRSLAVKEYVGGAVNEFGKFETYWNSTLFKQGTELDALARGNLEMVLTSAQEIAQFIPEFSIFATGYVHRDAQHQIAVFNADYMDEFKKMTEEKLKLKLLSVVYLGRRNLNLRGDKVINTPADLKDVKLRMPGSNAWQFLGKALGANPTPIAFAEVYTALQSGAVDGQDNPIPTTIDKKFYEVTNQVILTGHLVDLNYLGVSVDLWNKLTPEQRQKLQDAADMVTDSVWRKQSELEKEQVTFLEEQGLKVYSPDVDAFRTHVQQEYLNSEFSQQWPEGLLEKINNTK